MKVIGIIPARYGSTRFLGKPLALINNKPMIQHVYEQVSKSEELSSVVVATYHEDIISTVEGFGGTAILTRRDHETGSDRIYEVTLKVEGDFFVNVQGDEPLIQPDLIDALVRAAKESPNSVITAKSVIKSVEDIENPNVVKVVTDLKGNALYFSRSLIPYNRGKKNISYYKHIGVYLYPKEVLKQFVHLPQSSLEQVEMLEQLRLLENGMNIKVIETNYDAVGVDTPDDIKKVETILGGRN